MYFDYKKDVREYLKIIVDQHINLCFYFNDDQEKSKKLLFLLKVFKIYKLYAL